MALRKNVKPPVEEPENKMDEAVDALAEAAGDLVDGLTAEEQAEIQAEIDAETAADGKAEAAAKKKAEAAAKKKAAAAKKKAAAAAKKKVDDAKVDDDAVDVKAEAKARAKAKLKAELKAKAAAQKNAAKEPDVVEPDVVEPDVVEPDVVEETKEVVVKQQAPLPAKTVSAKELMEKMLYSDLEDGFIAEFGTLPRIIASNGNFLDGDKKILGKFITGQVLSWNKRFTITPSDDKAPDTLVRFSMDNKVLDDGSGVTVAEYIAELKAANYVDACSKEYYDVIFNLMTSEKASAHIGNMVTLQMSPSSKKAFNSFRLQMSFKISNGMLDIDDTKVIKFTSELVNGKVNTWTIFKGALIE